MTTYTTNKKTTATGSTWKGDSVSFTVPQGAELILVKDYTYCVKAKKRVDAYALKNPEKYYEFADNNYYYTVPDDAVAGILADAQLLRAPLKSKSDEWKETVFHWLVTIGGENFDYYMGSAHVTEKGTPKKPKLDDVLYSLVMDADACEMSFAEWCATFGYDEDSRKAFATYEQCQKNADKLRKAGVDIQAERERLADY